MIETAAPAPYPGSAGVIHGSRVAAHLKLIRAAHQELIDVTAALAGERRGPPPKRARSEVAA